jgi:hypothetical protein
MLCTQTKGVALLLLLKYLHQLHLLMLVSAPQLIGGNIYKHQDCQEHFWEK